MEDFISRRLLDLAQQSDRTARFTFSDFLTEAEFAAFSAIRSQLPDVGWTAFGGYPQACQRKDQGSPGEGRARIPGGK